MLGFYLFLAIISIVATLALLIGTFFVSKKWLTVISAVSFIAFSVFMFNYVYDHESSYYHEKGNPKTLYAQVSSQTATKISVSTFEQERIKTFTLYEGAFHSNVNEGDVVKIIYVDGIYRAFAVNIQKYVPAEN